MMDGCAPCRIYWQIILPLSLPALATAGDLLVHLDLERLLRPADLPQRHAPLHGAARPATFIDASGNSAGADVRHVDAVAGAGVPVLPVLPAADHLGRGDIGAETMSRALNVAVAGLGVGKEHLAAYARLPDLYRIKAVCDLDAARAAVIAAEFGAPIATSQFAELIVMRDLDVIDICTPPGTHRTLVEQALRAGYNVVCEKPLVGSLKEADALIAMAETVPGTLFPVFQYRFGNGLQKLKFLQARVLTGRAYLSTIETSWRRPAEYYAVPWRGKWATELGGCCLSQADPRP